MVFSRLGLTVTPAIVLRMCSVGAGVRAGFPDSVYATAGALAADLRRFLAGEPTAALSPDSARLQP